MGMRRKPEIIHNSGPNKGKPVLLNQLEQAVAESLQAEMHNKPLLNALGYEIDITTLTTIIKKVSEQKFYRIPFAEYLSVRVGEGAWSTNLLTYTSFQIGEDFETGIINTGSNNSRIASTDAGVQAVPIKVFNWAKSNDWSLIDLNIASKSGNWDLITGKEESRKTNWDLGLQRVAFLGSLYDSNIKGLLTQADVVSDISTITEYIKTMSAANFNIFVEKVVEAYRSNCNKTAYPNVFIMPEKDFTGLGGFPDATFPVKSKITLLQEIFAQITMNKNFKILPLAYAEEANEDNIAIVGGYNRYCLLNYDDKSVRMDIPVDYTATLANSINNFQFQNVGYGQFTGVKAYRPLEMLYFDWQS
jgi:hypothetical protein